MIRQHQSSYLEGALAGGYSEYSEDRLSQIFCTSFNHSGRFRKIFLDTVNIDSKSYDILFAQTQIGYEVGKEDARIDIIIYKNSKPYVVIENKVDAPLTNKQLNKYDKVRGLERCKKLAIVKHYFDSIFQGQWKIYHWADLYSAYKRAFVSGISNQLDKFVISNFIEYLEMMNMSRVHQISKSELIGFSQAIHNLRFEKSPYVSLTKKNIFEMGGQLLSVLEEIIDLVRQEPILTKSIGGKFRFSPVIGSWWQDEKTGYLNFSIHVQISVPKTKNKVKYLGTGFFFYNDYPKKYAVMTYAKPKNGIDFIEETYFSKKDLIVDKYAKEVISNWKKWATAK